MPVEDPAVPVVDVPVADAAPQVTPETTPEAPVEEDPFASIEGGEPAQFPREYVEKLRREGAKYRTAAKEHETELEKLRPLGETFDGWEDEQVAGFREFITAAKTDQEGALAYLIRDGLAYDRDSAVALLDDIYAEAGTEQPGAAPAPVADPDDDDRPITRRELRELKEAEDATAAQTASVQSVKNEAKEFGYDPDAKLDSLDGFKYQRLLSIAANVTGNDLKQAHEALVAEEQALVKSHMDKLAQEADLLPTPSGTGGPAAAVAGVPDWNETSQRAREFLRAQTA